MKKLGLIGGVGPESTITYYRLLLSEYLDKTKTKDYPEIVIHSINMTEMLGYVFNNQFNNLVDFLVDRIKILEGAGVDFGAIASNTPHIVFDKLAEQVELPLISIVEETCKAISNKKLKQVALYGTKSTMTAGFYQDAGTKYGIEIILPDSENLDYIHDKYLNELVYNKIVPETKNRFISITKQLIEHEAIEGLILGGTELPIMLDQSDFNSITVFDTSRIHVEAIIAKMISI